MKYLDPQVLQSLDPRDYKTMIVVFGSRYWGRAPAHRKLFHESVVALLEDMDGPVLFISGAAPSGADNLIIEWCNKFRFPCKEMPANWNRPDGSTDKAAGFRRNDDMAVLATHGLGFWDGVSPGTEDMANRCLHHNVVVRMITIGELAELPPLDAKRKRHFTPEWQPSEKLIHALDEEDDDAY